MHHQRIILKNAIESTRVYNSNAFFRTFFLFFSLITFYTKAYAIPDNTQLAVWANEAIVATYTYNAQNFLMRQKEIAQYFTANGWMAYSKALIDSKLPEAVQENSYFVSAVATSPPEIKALRDNIWQAVMPTLVVYKNPQYQQKQTLEITIDFTTAPAGQGIRGLAILSLQTKVIAAPCQCPVEKTSEPVNVK